MHVVDVREALSDDARLTPGVRLHILDEAMQRGPPVEAEADDLGEKVGSERVVVAAVARFADALGDAALEEAAGLGADAGLADVELVGELVEGAGLVGEEEGTEETAGDAGESVVFGGESHALDEVVSVGHGEVVIWNVQYKLNDKKWPAFCPLAPYILAVGPATTPRGNALPCTAMTSEIGFAIMSDAIRPALEPGEWKLRRSGPISLDVVDRIDYIVIEGPGGETVKVTGTDEIFALISLANDALPPEDPRKITHGWLARVETVRDMIRDLADSGDPKLASLRHELALGWDQMAQVLSAILPPVSDTDHLGDDGEPVSR